MTRTIAIAFGAAAALLGSLGLSAAGTPAENQTWTEVRSPHYTVFSSAGGHRTLDLVKRLERYDQTLAILFERIKIDPPVETYVFVFKDPASREPFQNRFNGKPVESLGYFLASRDANFVNLDGTTQADPLPTIYHERMHEFEHEHLPPIPPWFSEGLAECYDTFRTDIQTAEIGLVQESHVAALRSLPFMPLHDLFAVTQTSTDYNEGERRGIFYAESWALVHYLLWDAPQRRPQLVKFLSNLGQGQPQELAVSNAFNVTVEGLEAELRRQIGQDRFHQTIVRFKAPLDFDTTAKTRTLGHAEVEARLGEIQVYLGPDFASEAEKRLQASLVEAPGNGVAARGLALLRVQQRRTAEAIPLFEAALAANPHDVVSSLHLAESLLSGRGETATTEADIIRARGLLAGILSARPSFAEASVAYARSLLHGNTGDLPAADLDRAIRSLEGARAQLPYRSDAAANLAVLYAVKGEFDQAKKLVQEVLPAIASEGVLESTRSSVNSLRRIAGLKDSAATATSQVDVTAAADEAATAAPDPTAPPPAGGPSPGSASRLPEDPEARRLVAVLLSGRHAYSDEINVYNSAMTLANQGIYRDAIRSLEALASAATDTEMQSRARAMIGQMRKDAKRMGKPVD